LEPVESEKPSASGSRQLMSSLRLVSLGTLLSRILGLFRDMAMTSLFGAGTVLDAFLVAFRLPNLSRQLLGEGAVSTAFLPIFLRNRNELGTQAARETLTLVALLLAATLTLLVTVSEAGLAAVWHFVELSESSRLLVWLLALMLPYSLVICLAALFCAALHAQRQFLWPSLVPVVLNLIWLTAIGMLYGRSLEPVQQASLLAVCVTAAGGIQMLLPYWALHRQGLGLTRHWRRRWKDLRELLSAILPVLIGMTILQGSAILDSLLAWGLSIPDDGGQAWCQMIGITPFLGSGTASALYLGQRMLQFPLGIFGIALGTVLYPLLTQHAQQKNFERLREDLSRGLRMAIAIGIPASAGLCVIAWPLTLALFQRGEFSEQDADLTAKMIGASSLGIWSMIGIAILNRACYAMGDRTTPMRLGLFALVFNQMLNLILIWPLGGVGLPVSSAITSGILCLATLFMVNRNIGRLDIKPMPWTSILWTLWNSIACASLMLWACFGVQALLPESESLTMRLGTLLILCATGTLVVLGAARLFGMKELEDFLHRK